MKMRFKYSLMMGIIFIILFSITCVEASENMTDEIVMHEHLGSLESFENNGDKLSVGDNVDLSVDIDVKPSYVDGKYNPVGSEVPWTITVSANGGTARNVQVRDILSPNLRYVSSNVSCGEFNHLVGIWKVGDLTGNASMTIITKLNREGTYMNKVYATTDSVDVNQLNNFKFISIKTGSSKITSNITETTDDRFGANHDVHYQSMVNSRIAEDDSDYEFDDDEGSHTGGNSNSNGGSDDAATDVKYSASKSVLFFNIFSLPDASNETLSVLNNQLKIHFDAIPPYDFTTIPILIFSLFICISLAIVAYNRFRGAVS